jgi:hypothetical protein
VAENILAFLFLFGMSAFCWLMVLRPSLRQTFGARGFWFGRLREEDREGWDAMMFAAYLVVAMVFSLVTLAFLFMGIYRIFGQ